MNSNRKINTAIIGVGEQGYYHTYKLKNYYRSNLVAICDKDKKRAKEIGEEFDVEYYTDYKNMLENEDIEAISVCTPDFAHKDPVVYCLNHNLHVIVQKPFATKFQDAKKMAAASKENNKLLITDYINRWNPEFYFIKEAIENDELGEPILFNFRGTNSKWIPLGEEPGSCKWAGNTSLVGWLGSHFIDLTLWLSGSQVIKVYACARKKLLKRFNKDINDFYQIIMELDNGLVSTIRLNWIMPDTLPNWVDLLGEVIGTKGAMRCSLGGERNVEKITEAGVKYIDPIAVTKIRGKINSFAMEVVEYFLDCIYEDIEPFITPDDGLECVKIMEAIEQSAKEGSPVLINETD